MTTEDLKEQRSGAQLGRPGGFLVVSQFQRAIELSKAIVTFTESVLFCAFERVGINVAP